MYALETSWLVVNESDLTTILSQKLIIFLFHTVISTILIRIFWQNFFDINHPHFLYQKHVNLPSIYSRNIYQRQKLLSWGIMRKYWKMVLWSSEWSGQVMMLEMKKMWWHSLWVTARAWSTMRSIRKPLSMKVRGNSSKKKLPLIDENHSSS